MIYDRPDTPSAYFLSTEFYTFFHAHVLVSVYIYSERVHTRL